MRSSKIRRRLSIRKQVSADSGAKSSGIWRRKQSGYNGWS